MYLLHFISLWLILLPIMTSAQAIQIVATTDNSLTLEFTLPHFTVTQTENCQSFQVENWATADTASTLPITGTLIQVPATGDFYAEIIEQSEQEMLITSPCPHLSSKNSDYQPISVSEREIWRNTPVAQLTIEPFHWQENKLRYIERMQFIVHFTGSLPPMIRQRSQFTDLNQFSHLLYNTVLNYRPTTTLTQPTTREGKRVLNTPTDGIRITLNKTGIYRINYEDLQATGVTLPILKPEKIQLFNQDKEIAIQVVTAQPEQFQAGDFILFYGQGLDTEFTDVNQYWLQWRTKGSGKRVDSVDLQDATITEQSNEITTFYSTYRVEQNDELWQGVPGAPEDDYWFWTRLDAPQTPVYQEHDIILPNPVIDETLEATVKAMFQGRSTASAEPNHHTITRFNGQLLEDGLWSNDIPYMQENVVKQNLLRDSNLFTIDLPGDTDVAVDTIYFNWLEVTYWRYLAAVDNELTFTLHDRGQLQVTVTHFTTSNIRLYDVTHPEQVIELKNFTIDQSDVEYSILFTTEQTDSHTYYVTTSVLKPTTIQNWQSTGLKSIKNAADYLIITDENFLSEVAPLLEWRQQQGLRVKAVSVQAIYNEFNQGVVDPKAVKNFLTYAYENWSPPAPTYVFLIGDASVDYRHYLATSNKENYVPVHFSSETKRILSSDDNWYVAVQGNDVLPEMFIGRAPARSKKTVTDLVQKIIKFEKTETPLPYKTLLISDAKEEYKQSSDAIYDLLPAAMEKVDIWVNNYTDYDKATEDIISVIDQGVGIVNYTGHGAVAQWGFTRKFFGLDEVKSLSNVNKLPFVVALSCANGHFAMPDSYSLSEEFMKTATKGAIASFSPSRLSFYTGNQILAEELFNRVLQPISLGEITTGAKVAAYARGTPQEFMKMYMLFGDPATQLRFQ